MKMGVNQERNEKRATLKNLSAPAPYPAAPPQPFAYESLRQVTVSETSFETGICIDQCCINIGGVVM